MKRVFIVIILLILAVWGLIQSRESTPTVSIPVIPHTTKRASEAEVVEQYVRAADIATLTQEQPVLGGSWYYTEVIVHTSSDTVAIAYEDGHIAGKGTLAYTYDETTQNVTVNGFTPAK